MNSNSPVLFAHLIGIDTYQQPVIFLRRDCQICRSEGFEALARVRIEIGNRFVIATLNTVEPELLEENRVGLSDYAWRILHASEGDVVRLLHPTSLDSLSFVRSKIYGHRLNAEQMQSIISDISSNYYSDINLASFITACSGGHLNTSEILHLSRAMINAGDKLTWSVKQIVDKHCIGGVPGNRTTMLVVPIVAAFGLTIPKTSSRAITSPAGTADTMEVLAPVHLDLTQMRRVVSRENGCIVWGGASKLSPADDILIRVERALNLDNEGQLVASVLSKKVSAGSTHVVIDIPIGSTAKVRTAEAAEELKKQLQVVGESLGMTIKIVFTDGSQPVGMGIGPVLEALDVLEVLQCKADAPKDLRERSLQLAGEVLEFSSTVKLGTGASIAQEILDSGKAWAKFQAICEAQGGMREPRLAEHTHTVEAHSNGVVIGIDNRRLSTIAKLAGAPRSHSAGIMLHTSVGTQVEKKQPLFTIYSDTPGELQYALHSIQSEQDIMQVEYNI